MNPAIGNFASVTAIVSALKAQAEAVKLEDDTAAFQRVELFDSENLLEAFELLTLSEQRICVVVPLTADFETDKQQRKLLSRRTLHVVLLISDSVMGDRTAALYGDETTPGAFKLSALTVPLVTGQILANPGGVISMPTNEDVIIVKNEKEKQNLPGRAAVALELECKGGWIEAVLGVGPSL